MKRRDFLLTILPSRDYIDSVIFLAKCSFIAIIGYFLISSSIEISLQDWIVITLICAAALCFFVARMVYLSLRNLAKEKSPKSWYSVFLRFEGVLNSSIYVVCGIAIYRKWIVDPAHAYILAALFIIFVFAQDPSKSANQSE